MADIRADGDMQLFAELLKRWQDHHSLGNAALSSLQLQLAVLEPHKPQDQEFLARIRLKAPSARLKAYARDGPRLVPGSDIAHRIGNSLRGLQDSTAACRQLLPRLAQALEAVEQTVLGQLAKAAEDDDTSRAECGEGGEPSPGSTISSSCDQVLVMACIYDSLSHDLVLMERVATAVDIGTDPDQLSTYAIMWALQPYVDDEVVQQLTALVSATAS